MITIVRLSEIYLRFMEIRKKRVKDTDFFPLKYGTFERDTLNVMIL